MWRRHNTILRHLVSETRIDLDNFRNIEVCFHRYHFHRRFLHYFQNHLMLCIRWRDQNRRNHYCKRLTQDLLDYVPTVHHIYNSFPRNKICIGY